ncbi:cyanophycinase [Rhodovulum sp. 12E13]|uniref:cyanophycinase n=1 Tax=Rhodovulum sp. 12E13 TaxID=2203891 RepID=UPI000E17899A|nr:cyanophycinase [Rhodovulum sp. 12E13]RDC69749.1 cyanophycinase [Rhodovulum sp. 12E13]
MNTSIRPVPRGKLVAIGGAEDKTTQADILKRVLGFSDAAAPIVSVITTASSIPDEVFAEYQAVFKRLGASEVLDVRIRERADTRDPEMIEMLARSDVIFISGGDQMRLTSIFGGSPALEMIRKRHTEGAVIAGTSAGAACQSTTMVYGGDATDALRKGVVKMAAGFGLIAGVIVDTHFLERGRFSRLMEVGATNPEYLGVGLGEDAAVLFDGDRLYAFGPGHVILVDSTAMTGSNVFDLSDGEVMSVHNVVMHALIDGDGYDRTRRTILGPEDIGNLELKKTNAHS